MDGSKASNEAASSEILLEQALVTEIQIQSICGEVVTDWRDLGIVLGIASVFMDIIEADYSASREKASQMLLKWKQKEGNGATVGILINALAKTERKDVAEKLLDQRDTMKKDQASQRRRGVKVQQRYDEVDRCLRCPNLEKELKDLKAERDTLKNKISQLEDMRADDEQERKDTKTKDEIIRENNTKIADLERTNRIQLDHIEELERINEKIKTKKRDLVEEKEMMKKQIGELKAEEEELKLKLQVQIDPKELDQLKTQNGDLSSQIEELNRKVKSSESECKRLQEELKKSSKYRSPGVFFPTGNEFSGNCPGVICFLKKDASAKLRASRSSDGTGEASDILNHKKSTISGTAERENSWWSIDLGINHRLIITHYSLRQGKRHGESALTDWQLEGSHDGKNWKELKTIHNGKDPQFFAPPPFYTGTWSVGGEIPAFRFFRIFQTGRNSSGKYGIYLSGIELYGVLLNI